MDCNYDGKTWTVERRYNEFLALYDKLKEKGFTAEQLGTMPPKLWWGNQKEENIKKRKEGLQTVIDAIFANKKLQFDPDVCEFCAIKFMFDEDADQLVAYPTKQTKMWQEGDGVLSALNGVIVSGARVM